LSSSTSRKKHTRPANIRRHRARALGDDEESGSSSGEDDKQNNNKHKVRTEAITDLDWSTPNDTNNHKRPSGRSEKKQDNKRHGTTQDDQTTADPQEKDTKPVKWGLTINMKGAGAKASPNPSKPSNQSPQTTTSPPKDNPKRSIDDEALDSLLGNDNNPSKRKHSPSDDPSRSPEPEDYRSVPIDDFGATLLKSFGWDGKLRGKVKEVVPRHANLAGLGAKDAKGAEELTAWNQKLAGGRKDSRPPRLEDYTREERKKRQRVEEKYGDSYKRERERDKERERERGRDR